MGGPQPLSEGFRSKNFGFPKKEFSRQQHKNLAL